MRRNHFGLAREIELKLIVETLKLEHEHGKEMNHTFPLAHKSTATNSPLKAPAPLLGTRKAR